jgi:hypothetical protein
MIKQRMFSYGVKIPPLNKPFDLDKKDLLKKAEYQLEDLKKQYDDIIDNPDVRSIGDIKIESEVDLGMLKRSLDVQFKP